MGREALRRTLWAFDGRAEKTALSTAILDRFGGDPAKIVRLHQERRLLFMLSSRHWSSNMRRRAIP